MGGSRAAPPATSTADIRRRAAACAVAMAGLVAAINLWDGKPWAHVATAGLGAGVAGLATWTTYHLISRRNDGLAMFNIAITFANNRSRGDWLSVLMITAIGVLLGLVFGWTGRTGRPKGGEVEAGGPG